MAVSTTIEKAPGLRVFGDAAEAIAACSRADPSLLTRIARLDRPAFHSLGAYLVCVEMVKSPDALEALLAREPLQLLSMALGPGAQALFDLLHLLPDTFLSAHHYRRYYRNIQLLSSRDLLATATAGRTDKWLSRIECLARAVERGRIACVLEVASLGDRSGWGWGMQPEALEAAVEIGLVPMTRTELEQKILADIRTPNDVKQLLLAHMVKLEAPPIAMAHPAFRQLRTVRELFFDGLPMVLRRDALSFINGSLIVLEYNATGPSDRQEGKPIVALRRGDERFWSEVRIFDANSEDEFALIEALLAEVFPQKANVFLSSLLEEMIEQLSPVEDFPQDFRLEPSNEWSAAT